MDKGNVSKELANLIHKHKVVKGEKVGKEVPYYPPDRVPRGEEV